MPPRHTPEPATALPGITHEPAFTVTTSEPSTETLNAVSEVRTMPAKANIAASARRSSPASYCTLLGFTQVASTFARVTLMRASLPGVAVHAGQQRTGVVGRRGERDLVVSGRVGERGQRRARHGARR